MSNTDLRAYIFDETAQARAKEIIAYALTHRETLANLRQRAVANTKPPGAKPEHCLYIAAADAPQACKVVYSIEQHEDGWTQHLSISVDRPRMYPSPAMVTEILKLFDIKVPLGAAKAVDMEKLGPAKEAVNLWFAIDLKGRLIQPDQSLTA